ncbi:MAG: biotin--[acetyl-CoA-carboxylase] ligase [Nitrospirales bacterium]
MHHGTEDVPLSAEAVQAVLRTRELGQPLYLLDETSSTNTVAITLAQEGAGHGTTVVAERQTAGRGRLGRMWFSPARVNLHCSVVWRHIPTPSRLPSWLSWAPLASAVAAAHAIQRVDTLPVGLKWPNDLLVGHRKLGGILCESGGSAHAGSGGGMFLIIGIGVNVNVPSEQFPEDLRSLATSLLAETGRRQDRARLLGALLEELERWHTTLFTDGHRDVALEYRTLCRTLGQRVRIALAGQGDVEGLAEAVDEDGALVVRPQTPGTSPSDGGSIRIRAGDIVHLRGPGSPSHT